MPDILSSLRWQDIVDILIVSYIIYRLILLIRGTRAVQMLAGIVVITVIYFISSQLDLLALHWLLRTFLSSILLIVIIVFQRDIRRALAGMGKTPFLKTRDMAAHDLSEIISAAVYMARRRIGALIIIERENGLRDYVDSGFLIDARLLHELLVSIFFPMSPMHDGGVIIQDGRIHSAGCLLPLSRNPKIDKRYGTRHRAALGLSEETDAVIIVVSEETQEISIVQGGKITSLNDEEKLTRELSKIFPVQENTIPLWKNWLNRKNNY
ncbi:MAG: TIGR00159 family protein [Deltaproteobacteria bacterium]|nr:TIGR00159 family protein [Deltaproteobacteria bacterium]